MGAENPGEGETKAGAVGCRNGAGPARWSSPSLSVAGNPMPSSPKPASLEDHVDDRNSGSPQKREAERGDAGIHVSQENRGLARQLWKQTQTNEALAAEITSLQAEKASLQRENSDLKDEIQPLALKLKL